MSSGDWLVAFARAAGRRRCIQPLRVIVTAANERGPDHPGNCEPMNDGGAPLRSPTAKLHRGARFSEPFTPLSHFLTERARLDHHLSNALL